MVKPVKREPKKPYSKPSLTVELTCVINLVEALTRLLCRMGYRSQPPPEPRNIPASGRKRNSAAQRTGKISPLNELRILYLPWISTTLFSACSCTPI